MSAMAQSAPVEESAVAAIVPLARSLPPVLALGPFLKTTVTVIDGDRALVSHPAGDLDSAENITRFEATVARMLDETGVTPRAVAHDLHPDFHSTRFAQAMDLPTVPVQHHHAHIAAIAAEHQLDEPLVGLALDGFGLGPGNQSWGGECLFVDGAEFQRLGHLALLAQPGGDVAAREPWRMGAAVLHALGHGDQIATRYADQRHAPMLGQMLKRGVNCPQTSSCGRLFDAACGLLGVRPVADFEGQAPMELEGLATHPRALQDGWALDEEGVLDLSATLEALIGLDAAEGANVFHGTLIAALADWAEWAAARAGTRTVGLSGGCFFNKVLSAGLTAELSARGLTPLVHRMVSPGDPGVSLGQAWVAAQNVT